MNSNGARILCTTALAWLLMGCQTPPGPPPGRHAHASRHGDAGGPPPPPPLEAFQACEGLREGEPSGFVMPDERRFVGVCVRMGEVLVLMPDADRVPPLGKR